MHEDDRQCAEKTAVDWSEGVHKDGKLYSVNEDGKECIVSTKMVESVQCEQGGKECTEKMTVGWRDHSHRGLLDVIRGVFGVEEVKSLQSALYGHADAGRPGTGP